MTGNGPGFNSTQGTVNSLTISNTAGVTLSQNTTANGASSVGSGATLDTGAFKLSVGNTLTNNGTVNVSGNGSFQINQGGFATGNNFTYDQTTGALFFNNSSGSYGVNNDAYWPTTNGPQVVHVAGAGGITMNVARTVGLFFEYAAGVSNAGNLTLNGTSRVNAGGFTSGSPTYGPSALLQYNTGGVYGRNGEWLPNVTSGAGYPANVQLRSNTTLDLPNGSAGVFFQMAGDLTIDSGSTMNLNGSPAMTQPLNVLGSVNINGTLTLSTASGGDLTLGGNWTRTGTFTHNGRAVTFNGTGTQTIALGSAGTETFAYLIVDKASGDLTFSSSPATSVVVTSPGGGSALQIVNEGGINLNGNGLTLSGAVAGTNILVGGATASATRNITGTGTFAVTGGAKSVTNNNGKTLTFGTGVNVTIFQAVDFGASLTTVNGTLTIGSGGSVNTNPPTYGPASTLVYDCSCVYFRSAEWSATSGPGYPNNVQVNSGTDVNIGGGSPSTARQIAGTLDAKSGGRFLMDFPGSEMTAALTVMDDVLIEGGGSLNLSTVAGGDLKVRGDFTNNGTFTHNNRAVYFEGGATQLVNASSGSLAMPYVRVDKTGGTVQLGNTDLSTLGPSGGNSIEFTGATSTLTLNGRTLTLGSTVGTAPAGSGLVGDTAASLSLQDGGATGAMGTIVFASGGQALGNLTINRTGGSGSATLGSDLTLQSALTLTAGDILTGSFTLTHNGTSSGTTDVVGNVRRTDLGGTARSFGHPQNQISFQLGTAPTEITVNLVKSVPVGAGFGYPTAVQRTYTITPTGGSGYAATLRLHYNDSELNGNTEALLDFWRFNGTVWQRVVKTLADPITDNWIQTSAVTQFSPWTLAQGNALTKARLTELKATRHDAGVLVEWKTGYELDNLGFNLYRDVAGRRELVNSSLIAGSALVAGPHVAMTAGNTYSWTDTAPGAANARYWLEEVDLSGRTTTHGPFVASRGFVRGTKGVRSPVISQLTDGAGAQEGQRQWLASDDSRAKLTRVSGKAATATARERQRWLAAREALKISVRANGWYRVTREQLTAAGLSESADPTRLQLYADGVEVPIRVGDDGSVEFYGEALDVASTDTRVYWLTEGDTRGLRTDARRKLSVKRVLRGAAASEGTADAAPMTTFVPVGPPSGDPGSFKYTVERRERIVYFSGLQNGEAENFFGKVVNTSTAAQTLTVRNLLPNDAPTTTLEVSLQGLTAGEHHVSVILNGVTLGTLDFAGQTKKAATFAVESFLLREGDNQVQLVAGGAGDVSLTHYLRLSYQHTMRADGDRLRFNAPAGAVRVGGFGTPNVRVVDVTDPSSPVELQTLEPAAPDAQGGWSVRFVAEGEGRRELFAFADTQVAQPSAVAANKPSSWSADAGHEADMVVVTHGDFTSQLAPLVAQRAAEGMTVEVVDVEDLFDEFSYGAHTPQAVRDFLAWTKTSWTKSPSYVLLVGDGSYDPRDYLGRGRYDLVPSKLVDAGAMETASDDWFADFNDDGISDVAVGRLPVRTQTEAANVVNKIVSRTSDSTQTSALLVADRNGADGFSFEAATDGVQALLPAAVSVARVNRGSQDAATVRSQILAGVNAGPTVVNWMGHGSIDVWTGDGLLRGADAPALTNGNRLPLFVMMTCLNGYYEGTGLDSLAESVLKAEGGGAYAVWASSGMTEPAAQSEANRELYRIIFAEGGAVRLGDAVRRAKAATSNRDVRRTWVFFGDPSSRLR
ncbi:MAG TPA: C25 family cysteine peptidase [Pyrinomonadaceae bacterium]